MTADELREVGERWSLAMRRGDFEAAWQQTDRIEHERRALQARPGFSREPSHLVWDGTPVAGRDVLVRCTHGLGDTLQFVRYLPLLKAHARSVTFLVQPHLLSLFEGTDEFGRVLNGWTDAPPPPHEVELEVMELPYVFRSTIETLPNRVPYLPVERLCQRSAVLRGPRAAGEYAVGLLWAASDWDTSRSVDPAALVPLARVQGTCFYSLQQGAAAQNYAHAPFSIEPLHRRTQAIEAAAAAMCSLDMVITIDGMAAHLAGALGRPVWVLLKHEADWRWMEGRSDSPWYPTMRLFRQREPGDWSGAIDELAKALTEEIRQRRQRAEARTMP